MPPDDQKVETTTQDTTPQPPAYTNIDQVPVSQLEQWSGHWHALYMKQKRQHDISVKQIIWSQLFTVLVIGMAGVYLQHNSQALLLFGGALIVYPAISGLFSSNATALSASLHHEMSNNELLDRRRTFVFILRSLAQAIAVSLLASIVIGVLSSLLGMLFFHAAFMATFKLAILVATATGVIGMPFAVGIVLLIRKLQSNPDDIAGPTANTIFSFLPLLFIVVFSRLLA